MICVGGGMAGEVIVRDKGDVLMLLTVIYFF
jgi:hypothetical protein